MKIYFWPDGCWVFEDERYQMAHRSDDYEVLELPDETDEHAIDTIIFDEVSK